jgi:hypothetical protein
MDETRRNPCIIRKTACTDMEAVRNKPLHLLAKTALDDQKSKRCDSIRTSSPITYGKT